MSCVADVSGVGAVRVYLGLGSNLGDRWAHLQEAVHRLGRQVSIDLLSGLYETPPMGPQDQPWYLNAACAGTTGLDPRGLLAFVKGIEVDMGRTPTVRWGPRIIDIDLLFYGECVLRSPELVIPHPGIPDRAFVLAPLMDIAPELIHPGLKEPVSALWQRLSGGRSDLRRVASALTGRWPYQQSGKDISR